MILGLLRPLPPGILLLAFLLSAAAPRSGHSGPSGAVIARAGKDFITEKEFRERFEMLPGLERHRRPQLEQSKLEFLYSLIAEKLLAQEAADRHLDTSVAYRDAVADLSKDLARDALYRREVSGAITLTAGEIAAGEKRALTLRLIEFLYTDSPDEASFLRSQIGGGAGFDSLAVDSTAIRDSATVIFGDADPAIEDAAYRLDVGDISPVIHAGDGYYMLKLVREDANVYFQSMQPDVLRERVSSILRTRREKTRLNEYVHDALLGRSGYALPRSFRRLAQAVIDIAGRHAAEHPCLLAGRVAEEVMNQCGPAVRDSCVVLPGEYWSIGETIGRLARRSARLDSLSAGQIRSRLNAEIGVLVLQELLAGKALAAGFDTMAAVRSQVRDWSTKYLADLMRRYVGAVADPAGRARGLLDTFIAQSARDRGFDIYEDRLRQIPVTPVPMMTFRTLGFGGRMFAAPFVEKLIDWVNIDPPSAPVIP